MIVHELRWRDPPAFIGPHGGWKAVVFEHTEGRDVAVVAPPDTGKSSRADHVTRFLRDRVPEQLKPKDQAVDRWFLYRKVSVINGPADLVMCRKGGLLTARVADGETLLGFKASAMTDRDERDWGGYWLALQQAKVTCLKG